MISVIVPIYNAEKYLRRCLDSIVNQTYTNLEIILIDDDSKDLSVKVCREYAKKDKRIHIITKRHEGASAARNTGIHVSKGEYITFVDADDWLELDALESLAGYHAELVMGDFYIGNKPDGFVFSDSRFLISEGINFYLVNYLKRPTGHALFVYCWANLYKASIIKEHNIQFDKTMHIFEDGLFNIDYLHYVDNAVYVRKHIYHYNVNDHPTAERMILKEPLAFKRVVDCIATYAFARHIGFGAYVSLAIRQMIRYFDLCDDKKKIKWAIGVIVNDAQVQAGLRYYNRCKGDSWLIPLLMRLKWITPLIWACKWRAR